MDQLARILLVDDSLDDIDLTLTAFKECGLSDHVDVVYDGEEALDYLFNRGHYTKRIPKTPAFVLLDLKMQKIDGSDVLQAIRKSEEYQFLPVVMLSSSRMESDIIRSYQFGANAYIAKPTEYKELIQVIKTIGLFWMNLNITHGKS
jgi:CheY-like chemotaxis protein